MQSMVLAALGGILEYRGEELVERGIGSVKRLEFHTLPREGGWDYIYLNDNVQGS
jgi:hypothetical protein